MDDFKKIREEDCYYIDKTGMIKELLHNYGEVNLFTRPRRFGKTLNMSMLKSFFEIGSDPKLFDGLYISEETELCRKYMGKYPVIFLTLKQVDGTDFQNAKDQLQFIVGEEADRYFRILENEEKECNPKDKKLLEDIYYGQNSLERSILDLSKILYNYYGKKVIVLIDEYDVPLQKANQTEYYTDMARLISQFFGYGLKTNPYVQFSVVTGCLRVAKESIFTGFNNVKINTVLNEQYEEWFGFTEKEVRHLLKDCGQEAFIETTRQWYDGYNFGNIAIYCPWDVINWVEQLLYDKNRIPQNYWANSSDNALIKILANKADSKTREELETLIAGESVTKKINMELSYEEVYDSIENLWSIMLMTGYLTPIKQNPDGSLELVIPNEEVKTITKEQISRWFSEKIVSDYSSLEQFYDALEKGDVRFVERFLNGNLSRSISIRDSQAREGKKENFYHGMLLGLLNGRGDYWEVESNAESGDGYSDIRVSRYQDDCALIIEVKYADKEEKLGKAAEDALEQIRQKKYEQYFLDRGYSEIKSYGIAFYKKRCTVNML